MAEKSKISWTTSTFNPWRGCVKVSPGCKFCYADRLAARNPLVLGEWGPQGTRVLASPAGWRAVEKWNREATPGVPHYVFCCSLADVFEDWPGKLSNSRGQLLELGLQDVRDQLWRLIRATPNLTWQLLTKRPENIPRMMPRGEWPNVWLGTSLETQEYAWRLDALAEARRVIRCPVGFCSAEPLLGALDLRGHLPELEWLIIGGESGGGARPMHCDWAREIIEQCGRAGVACFVKQLGKRPVAGRYPLALSSDPGHNADPADWPPDLQVQEFPS